MAMTYLAPPISVTSSRPGHLFWDAIAALLILGVAVFVAQASRDLLMPMPLAGRSSVSLDPWMLPEYAARTTLRMLAAMVLSLIFTFIYATLAAKSRRAEVVLLPILDILQSVPILGFISVTVVFFMSLAPGRMLGAELVAVFAIFTSQAWNMALSFYQSLRSIPAELVDVSRCFHFSPWMRFWRIEAPYAMPQLIWNMMMSMSGGWFFVVAAEAVTVGDTTITLPGVGSYIALAIEQRNLQAIGWAIGIMLVVILIYDQLLFRPLVAWADRFRFEQETGVRPPRSWVLMALRRSNLVNWVWARVSAVFHRIQEFLPKPSGRETKVRDDDRASNWLDWTWYGLLALLALAALWHIAQFVSAGVDMAEIGTVLLLTLLTMLRVFVLIAIASLVWLPLGVAIGLRPAAAEIVQPVAQFLAAFPANLFFPVAVSGIVTLRLDPDIWLSPLMILGTQWYILFNVVAGASAIPSELRDIAVNLRIGGWLWWRKIALPAVFPYYVTGALTASGGAWNASIVSEAVSWGPEKLQAHGVGSYIAQATVAGDYHRIVLGIAMMSGFVLVINRAFWRPLYRYGERKFKLG